MPILQVVRKPHKTWDRALFCFARKYRSLKRDLGLFACLKKKKVAIHKESPREI